MGLFSKVSVTIGGGFLNDDGDSPSEIFDINSVYSDGKTAYDMEVNPASDDVDVQIA